MAALTPSVSLWVKSEPFTFGALPVPPHPRLTVNNIKRIVTYAKSKGKQGFPKLSYPVWKHIAIKKLELPVDQAWMYFSIYDLVGSETSAEYRLEMDNRIAMMTTPSEIEAIRSQMSVSTLKFVLFLYIQQLHRISLRASLVSGSDEWPMRSRSPTPELEGGGGGGRSGGKSMDEQAHLTFVLNNLNEIMELLVEPDLYSAGGDASDLALSTEAVEALGFLIAGSIDRNRSVTQLQDIALMQPMHQKSGYSKISRSFSYRSLQSWLRQHLSNNPFGISACISNGRRLSWPLAGDRVAEAESSSSGKRGRIATNALFVPKEHIKGNKVILMSQVMKQTIGRSFGTLEGSSIKIHRCHFSYIYLLSPLRSVNIEKCRHTTVVLGAVETNVHVSHCESCTVIAACRCITSSGNSSCTYHLLTPTRPLFFSGNSRITLAPYNTHYTKLSEHMSSMGLGNQLNAWDQPLCIGAEHDDSDPVWELMPPANFYLFSIPFEAQGGSTKRACPLPSRYSGALCRRDRQMEQWQRNVKDAELSKEQRRQLQSIVEARFQEWLVDTGHRRELDTLSVGSISESRT